MIGSATDLPMNDGQADALLLSQVIEHIPDIQKVFYEAERVIRDNGLLFMSYPYLYPLHAIPHDYFRLSRYAVSSQLKKWI